MSLLLHVFILLTFFLQSTEGEETTARCQLEYDGDLIRKVTLFSPEAVKKIPVDLEYRKPGQNDAVDVVKCDWIAPCLNNNDFIDSQTNDSLSIKIVSNGYCKSCGEFQFRITPDNIIKCNDSYQSTTMKPSSGSAWNGKDIPTRLVVGIIVVLLLTARYF